MFAAVYSNCTDIGPDCPVENSTQGYFPDLTFNAFVLTAFTCLLAFQVYLAFWKKTYFFGALLAMTCLGEAVGYSGRILMHENPYSAVGWYLNICCLDFAPSFLAAAVHATLKHITLTFGATTSIMPPPMYTWMFIGMDFVCLLLIGIGSGLTGHIKLGQGYEYTSYVFTICGIVIQILTLLIFAGLVLDYLYRTRRAWHNVPFAATKLLNTVKFKLFVAGVAMAYTGVLVRCCYRLFELASGWPNAATRSQVAFIVCESCMILIATLAFTIFHPAFCFRISKHTRSNSSKWRINLGRVEVDEPRGSFATSTREKCKRPSGLTVDTKVVSSPTDAEFSAQRISPRVLRLDSRCSREVTKRSPSFGVRFSQDTMRNNRHCSFGTWVSEPSREDGWDVCELSLPSPSYASHLRSSRET